MISDIREIKQIFRDLSAAYKKYGFIDDVKQFAKKEADLDEPLLLFVVGEGNFGKSTLVNTLIGKSYAAVSRLPRTWRVDVYRKSRKNYAELYFADRSVKKVSVARAINICKKYEKEGKEWKADLYQVVWHVADINIPESVSIVDTPGFAQFRSSDDEREVSILGHEGLRVRVRDIFSAYYYRADVVLWMFNARRINDKDTVEAVSKLQHLNKKVIGCISYFDFVPQDRANEIIDDAEKYFGSLTQTFVPLYLNGKTYKDEEMRNFLTEHYFPEAKKIKKAENLNFSKQKIKSIKEWILTYKDALTYNLGEADRIADSMRKYDLCDSVEDCVCFIKNNYIRRQGFSGDLISSVQNACNEALKKISDQFINHFSLHATSMRLKRVRQVEENKIIEELSPEIAVEAGVYSSQNLGRLSLLFVRLKTVGLMIFNFLACLFLACFGFVVIFTVVLFGAGIVLLLQVLHLIPIAGTAVAIGAIAIFFALAGEAVKEISGFFNEQIEKIKNEEKLALKNSLENEVSRLFDDQRITLEANKNAQIEIMRRSLDKTMEAYMGSGINKHPLMMKTIDGDVAFLDGISAQMKGDDGSLADDPTKQAVSSREEIGHTISPCGRCGQKLRFLSGEGSLIIGCPRCKNKFIYRANGDVGSGGTASDERA